MALAEAVVPRHYQAAFSILPHFVTINAQAPNIYTGMEVV